MEQTKIHAWMQISCAKSGCRFVARSKLVPAVITTANQLSYLKIKQLQTA